MNLRRGEFIPSLRPALVNAIFLLIFPTVPTVFREEEAFAVVASASQRFAFAFVSRLDEGGGGEEMKEDTRMEFIRV